MAARLVSRERVGKRTYLFTLDVGPGFPRPAPGQFVHLSSPSDAVLRRPFSIAGNPEPEQVELLIEVLGKATEALAALDPGCSLSVIGPLGNGFSMPDEGKEAALVAGGIGVAGLRLLVSKLLEEGRGIRLLVGARTREKLLDHVVPQPRGSRSLRSMVATDDGSTGFHGTVAELFAEVAEELEATHVVYCCGPQGMIRAVSAAAARHALPCQVSLEEMMACGVGACRGCVVMTRDGYKTVCSDGPVFDADELTL